MTRLLITARKRPEVDLEIIIGAYEFTVVPRSILESDGSLMIDTSLKNKLNKYKKSMMEN